MNIVAHIAGLMSAIYITQYVFVELESQLLGWVCVTVGLWLLLNLFAAMKHDWLFPWGEWDEE